MDPLLIDVPERIDTERMVLRCLQAGDGPAVNEAVCESLEELRPYMPWAQKPPTLEESEILCRRSHARFILREDLVLAMFERRPDGGEGRYIGGTGLHRILWDVRRFEIGYWRRSSFRGQGYVTEAARTLGRIAFDVLDARRVELRMDDSNERSWRIAEKLGYTLEGTLRDDSLTPHGMPRSTRIYARVRGVEEPQRTAT